MRPLTLGCAALAVTMMLSCGKAKEGDAGAAARAFIDRHLERARPLEKESNLAWWRANTTGKPEDFQAKEKAEN